MSAEPRILIVDNVANLAKEYAAAFRYQGWQAVAVFSGAAALDEYAQRPFDVVLLDLQMPGLDGFQVIAELRRMDPDACVIFFTGYGDVEKAVEALRRGAVDMLGKKGLNSALLIEKVTNTHAIYRNSLRAKRADEYEMLARFEQALSHQFRNNVAGLGTYLQTLEMKLQRPHQVGDLLALVRKAFATNKLVLKTLDRLDDFAKSRQFRPEVVSLAVAVERAVDRAVLMHAAHAERGTDYTLTVDVPADVLVVGHNVFLPLVLEAVLDNAIYALRERGDDAPGRIAVTAAVADGRAAVAVEDTGRGFSEFLLRNGPAMYRSGKANAQFSAGIGLATAQNIVEQCGGRLTIGNVPNPPIGPARGARVVVELQTLPSPHSPVPEVRS